ncbi:hypothetical protein D3C78_1620660 [compost metagenome]
MEVLIIYSIMRLVRLHQEVEEDLAIFLPFKSRSALHRSLTFSHREALHLNQTVTFGRLLSGMY